MPWINHPSQSMPTSLWSWLKFHVAEWMTKKGAKWSEEALYPNCKRCPECGYLIHDQHHDCIPF